MEPRRFFTVLPAQLLQHLIVKMLFHNKRAFFLLLVLHLFAVLLLQSPIEAQVILPQHHEDSLILFLQDYVVLAC